MPDNVRVDGDLKQKLDAYVEKGGKLIACGKSTLPIDIETPNADFLYDLGANYQGTRELSPAYVLPTSELTCINDAGYVVYAPTECATLKKGGTELAVMHDPYFNRTAAHFCSHLHAPEKPEYTGVGMSEGKHGIYLSAAIFREYAEMGPLIAKQLVHAAIDRLLGERKTLSVELPAQGNATLMDQSGESRAVLHLLYAPRIVKGAKKTEVIEDCVPLYEVPVALKMDGKTPKRIYTAPEGKDIPYTVDENGRVHFEVPEIHIHAMTVIDY